MENYQREFFRFAIEHGALRFGDFKLKSGRSSPYFFNTGAFNRGESLSLLGGYYAQAIVHSQSNFQGLYGPAYKGIPLVTAVAVALYSNHGLDLPITFNRKEAKDHGEGGTLVGAPLRGRILIVDDVVSAGTSIRESVSLIRSNGAQPAGAVVCLDRQERGQGQRSAIAELEDELGIPFLRVASLDDLVEHIRSESSLSSYQQPIQRYREKYGA